MKAPLRRLLLALLFLSSAFSAHAQNTISMANGQNLNIDGCQYPLGTIYDDGGPSGSYNNSFSGTVTISVQPGVNIFLYGNYSTESCCDKISVYDGNGTTGTLLVNQAGGDGYINTHSTTGYLTVQFTSNGSVTGTGFALSYNCWGMGTNCTNGPTDLSVSNITTTSALVSWNADNPNGPFLLRHGGSTTTVSTNSYSLSGLSPNTLYGLAVSSVADSLGACCKDSIAFRTACGSMVPPMQESFDEYGVGYNILPTCWTKLLNYDDTLNEPQIVGSPYSSFPGSLRMYCGSNSDGNHYAMVIGPRMAVADISTMSVRFRMRAAYGGSYLIVGVCDSTMRSNNNFTPVDTVTIASVNTWEEKVVDLASYVGSGKYVAFRMQRSLQGGDGRFIFIDDVALIPCGTWHERLYSRTSNSMWLSFDTIGHPRVDIEYGLEGFEPGTGVTVTDVTSSYRLTGLLPGATYQVRVLPYCNGANDEVHTVSWTTLPAPDNTLNRCEDFEAASAMPYHWLRAVMYDGTPCLSTNYRHSGSRSLRMRPNGMATRPISVLPLMDTVDLQHLNLSFYLYSDGYSSGRIEVGVMEYPEWDGSFVPVDTVYCTASGRWQYKQVSLAGAPVRSGYIALRASDPTTGYNSMYIDDLQLATCIPSGIHVTNIASHSVEIRWDTVGTSFHGDTMVVEYGGAGFAEGSGTRLAIPVRGSEVETVGGMQRIVVRGLTADSSYQFVVYGLCDTMVQHCAASVLTAHTLEQDIVLPYCLDFEGLAEGSLPAGWIRTRAYGSEPCVWNSRGAHTGTGAVGLQANGGLGRNHAMFALPLLDTDSLTNLSIAFFANCNYNNTRYLQVGVMTDPNDEDSFVPVRTITPKYNSWESNVVDLSTYHGMGRYIAFRWFFENCNGCNYICYIDDIIVSEAGTSHRTVSSITSHGATFTWQPSGRAYNGAYLEWGPHGFTRGNGTKDTVDANTFRYTVDTLQPNTQYDCFITALCSETDVTCNYTTSTFTTLEFPTVATYCYGFEDVSNNGFPRGWARPRTYDSRPRVESIARTGNRSLYLKSYNCGGDFQSSMAVMPYLEESDLTGLTLTFYTRGYNYYNHNRLLVGVITDPTNPATFDTIATIDYNWSDSWQRHTVDLSSYAGTGRHIAFWCVTLSSCYDGNVYIDDITLSRCDLSNIRLYSVTNHDAWLTWSDAGTVDSVDVEYSNTTTGGTPVLITNAVPPLHLTGLAAGTTYAYQLRPHCSGSENSCSNQTYYFTTRTDSIVPGYCEDFSWMAANQTPNFWTRLKSYEGRPTVFDNGDASYYTSPSRSIEFYTCSGSGDGNFIVMPAADSTVAGGVLSFSLRCSSNDVRNRALLTVGVMTLPYDSSTFVPIRTIRPTGHWQRYTVDLSSYSGSARHIAFRYTSLDGCYYSYLDDLGFSLCKPGDLRATDITEQSARLSWRQYGSHSSATRYTVEYGHTGFSLGTGTVLHTFDTSVTITGLTNSTDYQFYVWSSCQDSNECQQEHINVHTLDEPLLTPFCNNFDSETADRMPADWVRPYGDQYPKISSERCRSASKSLQFYSYYCNGWDDQTSMAVMPMLSDDISSTQIDFYFYNENPNAQLEVGIMTNPRDTNTFTRLHTIHTSGGWARVKRSLASYSGSGRYIAFRYRATGCSSGWAYIDDLTLRSCAITSCSLSGLGQDGVDVVWHATPTTEGVWMTYSPGGGTPAFYTSSPIHIDGLTEATQFVINLWPQCDSTPDNCNYETLREETLHTWVDIPFCSSFDGLSSGSFPNNWRRLSTIGTDYPRTASNIRHSEGNSLLFTAADSLFSLAAMPTINPTSECSAVSGLYANFWTYFSGNTSSARLVVGVMSDILDTNSFVGVDTLAGTSSVWEHHSLSLSSYSGNDHIIALKLLSADGNGCECYVDDLCIEKCVTSDLSITEITQNSITVTWTSQGTEGIVVEYGERGFAHGHGTFDTITSSPAVIDGLTELTEYEFNFISLCDCQIIGATFTPDSGSTIGGGYGGGGYGGGGIGGGGGASGGWGGGTGFIITTQANYLDIPYCESYETYDSLNFPPSYRRIVGSSNLYPVLTTTNHHSGESCIALYTTTDTACFMSLPPLHEGTAHEMVMTFYAYASNLNATSTDALHVGIMTNPDNPSTYTEIAAFRLTDIARWQQFSVDFSSYVGLGQYITFRYKPTNESYIYYIDDIYVGRCGITDVQFTTSPTSVQIGWTSLHSPSSVTIKYGRQGFDLEDSTYTPNTIVTTFSPYTITGIDPDSNYDFYIMAQCSDTDMALCAPVAYTLNPMLYPPYCKDFEDMPNDVMPYDWKTMRSRDVYPHSETQHGQQVIAFYPCSNNDNMVLLRPLPSGDSLNGKWVYAYFSTSNNNYIYLDLGTLSDTSDADSFVQMASLSNGQTETLREFNVQLNGNTTSVNRLAIRARSTSGCRWIRLSKFVLSNYPYPTALSSTVYGFSTQRITWNNQYNNPFYYIEYGFGDNWHTIASDSCSALLTGLIPSQTYQVYFISPLGERICLPYSFSTPDAVSLPYCDNFDSCDNLSVPPGWFSFSAYGDSYPRTNNSCYNSCCQTMHFYSNNNHLQYTALPDFDIDSVRNLDLQFSLRIEDVSRTSLVVGVMDDRTDFNTFTPVDTLSCAEGGVYYLKHINLQRYQGTGRFVAFRILTTSSRTSIYLDDLQVSACPLPDLASSGARQVKATIPGGSPVADYWLEYGPEGSLQGDSSNTVIHITQNPAYIGPFDPDSVYTFFTSCSEQGLDCHPRTLTIAHELPMPYCDDFSSYSNGQMPTGWTAIRQGGTPEPYVNGSQELFFGNYCNSNNRDYAIMPDLMIDSIRHAEIYFNLYSRYWNNQFLIVGVMDDRDDLSTFTPIDTLQCTASNVWQPQHVSFHNYNGTGRFIAFCAYRTSGCLYLYLDNLKVNTHPTPSFALTSATTVCAYANHCPHSGYWIEYGTQGCHQGDSSNTWLHVTSDTVCITNLNELTTYDFYHHADSGDITCFPLTRITTSTILSAPYCDNFDGYPNYQMIPNWKRHNSYHSDYPQKHHSGHLQFYNNCNSNSRSYAIMPEIDIDSLRHAELYFNMMSERNQFMIIMGVMSDQNNISTFVAVDTLRNSANNTWEAKHASLRRYSGNGRFIAFCMVNTTGNCSSVYIDDLFIQTCPRPTIRQLGATTVLLTLDESYSPDYWLEYGPAGIVQGAADTLWSDDSLSFTLTPHNTLLHITDNSYSISNLTPNTTYDFYSRCDSSITSSCYPRTRIATSHLQTIPYCDEFNSYGTGSNAFPTGWKRFMSDNNADRLQVVNMSQAADSRALRFNLYSNLYAYAVMPEMDIDSLNQLYLRLRAWFEPNTFLEVGIMTDMCDLRTFVPIDTIRYDATGVWEYHSTSLDRYHGQGRFVALRMRETNGNWRSIYIDRLEFLTCDIPVGITASLFRHNEVAIHAPQPSRTGFWLEYGLTGFDQGTGQIIRIDSLPTNITLQNGSAYDFYFLCDTLSPTCVPPQTVATQDGPLPLPVCFNFDTCPNNQMPYGWHKLRVPVENDNDCYVYNDQSHTPGKSLRFCSAYTNRFPYAVLPDLMVDSLSQLAVSFWMKNSNYGTFILDLGVMSDPYDPSSFITLKRFTNTQNNQWQRMQATLSGAPADAHFIAFRLTKTSGSWDWLYLDDLYISECGAADLRVRELAADRLTVDWQQAGNPLVTIEYGPVGFATGTGTTLHPNHPPYTITNLDNLTDYEFRFCTSCGDSSSTDYCNTDYCDTITLFTPAGGTGCIDPTNLTAEYTSCTYGSYSNPRSHMGIVDYGSLSALSRHTVHYDTTEFDPRTGGLLRTIPEGAEASVRLGNWTSNSSSPEAESVTYSLFVDPASFDLLILKYAAVLQDPEHSSAQQPRFSIEILDENNQLIDSRCGAADFIANASLGWNEAPGDVLWKDWTTVGLDMSAYANQTIRIRLTTYDCGEGSHYGYAYFTLDCLLKNIRSEYCGEVESNIFTMPDGFNYNWYTDTIDKTTLFTTQSINIPTSSITYYCDVSFVDNQSCYFTMSAFAGTRYPLALFDSTVSLNNCQFYVQFNNLSTISSDGVTPIGTGEGCETAFWDFGNGMTSTDYNGSTVYTTPGTYQVMLISYLGGGSCADTIIKPIVLEYPSATPSITGPAHRCFGNPEDTVRVSGGISYLWLTDDTTVNVFDSLAVAAPETDTTLLCIVTNPDGCTDTLAHTITVHPVYDLHDTLALCPTQLPYTWGDTLLTTGDTLYALQRITQYGCDSAATLALSVYSVGGSDTTALVCDSLRWYDTLFYLTPTLIPTHTLADIHGCDSTLSLHLTVLHSSHTTLFDTVEAINLPYTYHGHQFTGDTVALVTLTNADGCDSIVQVNLYVIWNTYSSLVDTICDNLLPYQWNHRTFVHPGIQYDTLPNHRHFDSLITMTLYVLPAYHYHFYDTICSNQASLFDGTSYNLSGLYTDSLHTSSTPACDSVRSLHLTVFPTTAGDTVATACDQFTWLGQTYTDTPPAAPTHTTVNTHGCDSTVTLLLTIHHSNHEAYSDTICQNALVGGYNWHDTLFYPGTASGTYTLRRTNQWQCDSTITLSLLVHHNTSSSIFDTIVENQAAAWQYAGIPVNHDTVGMSVTLANAHGCDSTVNYNLFIWPNNATLADSTICDNAVADFLWQGHPFADTIRHTFLNIHGADSTVTLAMHVNPTYIQDFYDTICDNQPLPFADSAFSATGSYTFTLLTSAMCDSIVTLHLTARPAYDLHFFDTIYSGDTAIFQDTPLTQPGDYPFHYTTSLGCDSVLTLHLTNIGLNEVHLTDSICQGDSVLFGGRHLTQPGVYRDTVRSAVLLQADTLKILTLFVLPYPTLSFDTSHICGPDQHYTLVAHTDAPYLQWTSLPYDDYLDSHEGDSILHPNPARSTRYYLFADYGDTPLCPTVDSIQLEPIQTVKALIDVHPDYLTYERRTLLVRNAGSNQQTDLTWHVWYYDGANFVDTARTLRLEVPLSVDSVLITLAVSNDLCADSDTVMVPSIVSNLFFPNIFTPTLTSNNTFKAIGNGIADFEIWIYDRRGDIVFHSTDIDQPWDGTHDGAPCPQAAYVYKCRYSTTLEPQSFKTVTRTVTLIR